MRVLVLGGTAFLARAVARQALARGHDVTCAARGSAPVVQGCTFVRVDRDDEDGLAAVASRRWDVVVDVARQPGHVRRAVRDLRARHWVFVSSGNVYARFDGPEQPESSPVLSPLDTDIYTDANSYGPAKVACENAVRDACPSHTIVRAGLIGGDGDDTGRSGYYPWRFAHPTGADVLVPPDLSAPIALIDVDDLATWIVDCGERRTTGTYNATGPTTDLACLLTVARAVAGSACRPRPVTAEAARTAGVGFWMGPASLPLWVDDPDWRWFATLDTSAARAQGLRIRPLATTLASALAHEERRGLPRRAGLTDSEERRLRDALTRGRPPL